MAIRLTEARLRQIIREELLREMDVGRRGHPGDPTLTQADLDLYPELTDPNVPMDATEKELVSRLKSDTDIRDFYRLIHGGSSPAEAFSTVTRGGFRGIPAHADVDVNAAVTRERERRRAAGKDAGSFWSR